MTGTDSRIRRSYLLILLVGALLVSLLAPTDRAGAQEQPPRTDVTLTLLHNNDGESALFERLVGGQPFAGIAPFATVVKELRREGDRGRNNVALVVSSGDNYLASAQFQASLEKGIPYYDAIAMDEIGYDASAIGNHEFDFGPEIFANFVQSFESRTPFVSSNLDFSGEPVFDRLVRRDRVVTSAVVNEGGERFGFVGATTEFLPIISSPRNVIANEILPAVQAEVDRLTRRGVSKIIMISQLQSIQEDIALAAMLDGVDIMVAGGGDELLANPDDVLIPGDVPILPYPVIATDADGTEVPIVTTSGGYQYVGRLIVDFDRRGNLIGFDDMSGPVRVTTGAFDDAVEPDRRVTRKVVEPVQAFVDALATTVVAQTQVPLNSARGAVATTGAPPVPVIPIQVTAPGERVSNTNLGNIAADSMLWQAQQLAAGFGVDSPVIAFQNGGGIRTPDTLLFAGATPGAPANVTRLDINNQFPFPNFVSVVEDVPVTTVKSLLENAVSRVEFVDGRFAHVAGMTYEWNSTGTPNVDRVRKITIGGVVVFDASLPLPFPDPAATFDVATIDFLARLGPGGVGGDGYNWGGLPFTTLGVTYEQAMLNYLAGPLGGLITDTQYPNAVGTRVIQTG
jgi:2',3'-cyclic-nucleotide 2'-phosphodiesterase (5'-nucleotidase family)